MNTEQARKQERDTIVAFLARRTLNDGKSHWPDWKLFLWAMLHPFKWIRLHKRMMELGSATQAIHDCDHLEGGE